MNKESFIQLGMDTIEVYHHFIIHNGIDEGTKRFRTLRTYYIKYVMGHEIDLKPIWLKTNRRGYPVLLSHLRTISKPRYLRIASSILNLTRLSVTTSGKHKGFDSIRLKTNKTEDFTIFLQDFDKFLIKFFKKLHIKNRVPDELYFKRITSKGPNSNITKCDGTYSQILDAIVLRKDKGLYRSFARLCNKLQFLGLVHHINNIVDKYEPLIDKKLIEEATHSRIAILSTPENKDRIVALVDYYSQVLLGSFSKIIDDAERNLGNSFMFDQDSGRQIAQKWTTENHRPVSCDSSDFTDRFPYEVQRIVVNHLTGDHEISNYFFSVLRSRGFKAPGFNKKIWYGQGQPMGANCSFQIANITHALIACYISYKNRGSKPLLTHSHHSAVVGDDIVFKYGKDARHYKHLFNKVLNMELSSFKGFNSKGTVKVAEFCKRTYLNGMLVSGLSPRPTLNFCNDYKHVFSFQNNSEMDYTELTGVLDDVHKGKSKVISDLLFTQEAYKSGDIICKNKYNTSEDINLIYDQFAEMPEQLRIAIFRAFAYCTFYLVALSVARQIEQLDLSAVSHRGIDLEGGVIPPSDRHPISFEENRLTPVFANDIRNLVLPYIGKDVDYTEKPWPTFVHIAQKYQVSEIYSNPVDSTEFINLLLSGDIEINQLIQRAYHYHSYLEELRSDLFGTDSFSFANSPLGEQTLRRDEKREKERDKTLFLFSSKLLATLRGLNIDSIKRYSCQLDTKFPELEMNILGLSFVYAVPE